ncbi:single-stranded DNA-binding protein [Candidatus Saccharibacteria bacterium]|nr:single-stranded DNA-binding protein [Candidatus Saccharibacteria bacterium]
MNRDESIRFASKFLEDLLSFFGVNLAVKSSAEEDVIYLAVPSSELNAILIGRGAETLRSLQSLVMGVLLSKQAELYRVNIDVADYKKQREHVLEGKAETWAKQVRETGETMTLDLNAYDRRIVHKVIGEYSDLETHSEGEGRERRLIITKVAE